MRLEIEYIEHKEPKDKKGPYAHRAFDWDNFLFACTYCNSNKGIKDPRPTRFLFPDEVNTACIFEYVDGGKVIVSPLLTDPADRQAADDTHETFLKLNNRFDSNGNIDSRWRRRVTVWSEARQALENLKCCNSIEQRVTIVSVALGLGCFSVWMTVFADDADMCNRFIAAFPGTRATCYDASGKPIADLSL